MSKVVGYYGYSATPQQMGKRLRRLVLLLTRMCRRLFAGYPFGHRGSSH